MQLHWLGSHYDVSLGIWLLCLYPLFLFILILPLPSNLFYWLSWAHRLLSVPFNWSHNEFLQLFLISSYYLHRIFQEVIDKIEESIYIWNSKNFSWHMSTSLCLVWKEKVSDTELTRPSVILYLLNLFHWLFMYIFYSTFSRKVNSLL